MAIYRTKNNRQFSNFRDIDKVNNQAVLIGENETFPVADGIFLLETLQVATGDTVDILDGEGNTIVSAINSFQSDVSPIRCDYGVEIVGTVIIAKGYFMPGIFS